MSETPRPTCFVAMPFGKKSPPGTADASVDFDVIFGIIKSAVKAADLECIRADYEINGGFIHRSMYERLILAEYVIADLTFANPNVTYEVGLRHGGSIRPTLLIAGKNDSFGRLPFDFGPLRVIQYDIENDGHLTPESAVSLGMALRTQLSAARGGDWPPDNPIIQLTEIRPSTRVEHEKTDAFLDRTRFFGAKGREVAEAISLPREQAIDRLSGLAETLIVGPDAVHQAHSLLLTILLGFREHAAYERMIDLAERLPTELRKEAIVYEQLALAINRCAETAAESGNTLEAEKLRDRAIDAVQRIPEEHWTSETYGILGRIYKGAFRAFRGFDPDRAKAMLTAAIRAYEYGFRADLNDYYPGVNAVTLRLVRDGAAPDEFRRLLHAVRVSVDRARKPSNDSERYWQVATKLELASLDRDWESAEAALLEILACRASDMALKTTAENLSDILEAFTDDETRSHVLELIQRIRPKHDVH